MSATDESISFGQHIKPLFREKDRESMMSEFDLWSYDDVSPRRDAILSRLRDGSMPCDGVAGRASGSVPGLAHGRKARLSRDSMASVGR